MELEILTSTTKTFIFIFIIFISSVAVVLKRTKRFQNQQHLWMVLCDLAGAGGLARCVQSKERTICNICIFGCKIF